MRASIDLFGVDEASGTVGSTSVPSGFDQVPNYYPVALAFDPARGVLAVVNTLGDSTDLNGDLAAFAYTH